MNRLANAVLYLLCVIAGTVCAGNAFSQSEPTAVVDQQRCMFCHTVDTPFRAPSFRQIAERYRNVPGASDALEAKLRVGGRAHWGDMAMPSAAGACQ